MKSVFSNFFRAGMLSLGLAAATAGAVSSEARADGQIDLGRLSEHLGWCMKVHSQEPGQQGVTNFRAGSNEWRSFVVLRNEYALCQSHNPEALRLIAFASDYEFERSLTMALPQIEGYVRKHLEWVAYNRARAVDLQRASFGDDAPTIRRIFNEEQASNPEARSNIKGVSDLFLSELAATL